ncbi:MAG: hypothetical protein ACHQF2_06580 [Flavobacteriales bacterium]
MKNTILILFLFALVFVVISVSGCAKENEEDLLLDQQLCKVDTVSFSQHIQPYINARCMPCHTTERQEGGIILEDWANIMAVAAGGELMGTMKHEPGYPSMPDNGPKPSDCAIAGFELWISQGMHNN